MSEDGAECLLERLRLLRQRSPEAPDAARGLTARICGRLTSHDKTARQNILDKLWIKNSEALQTLLSLLENTKDPLTTSHIISIFRETICMKQGKGEKVNNQGRACSAHQLVSLNATQTITRCLLQTQSRRDGNVNTESLLHDCIWVLAALAPKDQKFSLKMRTLGCVRTMHLILKAHYTDNKVIFPLLSIMKQLSKNSIVTSILVRDGVATTYERILASLGSTPNARLRLCCDAIDYFSRNRVFAMHMVKLGLCHGVMRVFDRWERYEGRSRHRICAHILQTLLHLCVIQAGRRALCTKKNVQSLYRFCTSCPDEPEFDTLLARVCCVITLCLKQHTLPVSSVSPAVFNLNPILKGTNISWPIQNDEDEEVLDSESKTLTSEDEYPELDEDDNYNNNSEDIDSDINMRKPERDSCNRSFNGTMWVHSNERDIEDLKRYSYYFREFGSYSRQVRLVRSRSNSKGSVLDAAVEIPKNLTLTLYQSFTFQEVTSSAARRRGSFPTMPDITSCKKSPDSTVKSSLKIHEDLSLYDNYTTTFCLIASRVRSVLPFVKVAYPDMMGDGALGLAEPLNVTNRSICRTKLLSCVERAINPDSYVNEVAYDLDLLYSNSNQQSCNYKCLTNNDAADVLSKPQSPVTKLSFESRFESGNLRKALQIGPREYDLILLPDVNSSRRLQWFYFEVRGMQPGRPYVFNIVNCEKSDSQFKYGMKPLMYSVKEATLGRPGWVRSGHDICYYRNSYSYGGQKSHNKCYLTVTFTINFPHANDVCYLAYHFPYTYSALMTRLFKWTQSVPPNTIFRVEPLCQSLNNNEVPLITVTAEDTVHSPVADRPVVFLTARVHPGESNASWVMDGTLEHLLRSSHSAERLRSKYVFKIVPMLNVEGVVNGCHRCGLTNEDLNRRWCKPSPVLHPTIYHTKGLMEYLARVWRKPPLVYCDYHGHSRMKNVFLYGCSAAESWCSADKLQPDQPAKYLMLPALMHRTCAAFALGSCSFRVERTRESTARVAVWRQLGVAGSYTMEASYCGFDRGPYKGLHLNTQHLQKVGSDFCEALNGLSDETSVDIRITRDIEGNIVDVCVEKLTDKESVHHNSSGSNSAQQSDSEEEEFD